MPTDTNTPTSGAEVFLAEEDDVLRAEVALALRRAGYTVTESRDGASLFSQLEQRLARPGARRSIVVAQARLPGVGALPILHSLRRLDIQLPVILLTRLQDPALPRLARTAGAAALLAKPVVMEELLRTVAEMANQAATR